MVDTILKTDDTILQDDSWLDRSLYPFESKYTSIEGHTLHFIDEGSGPILLFVHSTPIWSFMYRHMIRALSPNFRCIAFDLPGFGFSQAAPEYKASLTSTSRLIERFIEQLNLHEITIVTHSLAVSCGLGVVGRRPELFRGALVSNSFAWPLHEYPEITRFLGIAGSRFFGFLIHQFNFLAKFTATKVLSNLNGAKLTKPEQTAIIGPFLKKEGRRKAMQSLYQSILKSQDYLIDLEQRLLQLPDFPVFILFGDGDAAYGAGWVKRFEEMFKNHHTLVLEGGDHFPCENDPARVANEFNTWWHSAFS